MELYERPFILVNHQASSAVQVSADLLSLILLSLKGQCRGSLWNKRWCDQSAVSQKSVLRISRVCDIPQTKPCVLVFLFCRTVEFFSTFYSLLFPVPYVTFNQRLFILWYMLSALFLRGLLICVYTQVFKDKFLFIYLFLAKLISYGIWGLVWMAFYGC